MPYTLTKGLLWFALALLLGIVIGWLLRSIRATGQVRAARAHRHDAAEIERLRGRIANLEPAVAERDQLKAQVATQQNGRPVTLPAAAPVEPTESLADPDAMAAGATAEPPAATNELVETIDVVDAETAPPSEPGDSAEAGTARTVVAAATVAELGPDTTVSVLGTQVTRDDLTAVEGIDAAIAGLCNGIGIHTWSDLATTEVSLLRTMLADAGPPASDLQPDAWPEQATLLAAGQWEQFESLVARLRDTRSE